jgi:hypothetical protein
MINWPKQKKEHREESKSFWGLPKGNELKSVDADLWHEHHTWVRCSRIKLGTICVLQTKNLMNKVRHQYPRQPIPTTYFH